MMNALELQSERYSPTGNLASSGVLNQLGRPTLDPLTVLVRETVQNSWDAAVGDGTPVLYGIAGFELSARQVETLRSMVFAQTPPDSPIARWLDAKRTEPRRAFAIYDRGTVGLGGPTRADGSEDVEGGEPHDFVDFLRNVGTPPDKELGGGTFGYGKAALYINSEVQTICVHTHCSHRGQFERRFMAAGLGERYQVRKGTGRGWYTGRHWWGRAHNNFVEPVTDNEADTLAAALGMPPIAKGERGTTILVLEPRLGGREPAEAMNVVVGSLLWSFWPKMLRSAAGSTPMRFELSWNGAPVAIPSPESFPPLQGFVSAMEHLRGRAGTRALLGRVLPIDCERPKRHLGRLALQKYERRPRVGLKTGEAVAWPIDTVAHHVAVMRQAELVVRYIEGPPLAAEGVEYAGVFVADAESDRTFAHAEPPTHDDWLPESLADAHERTFVRVALRRIREAMKDFAAPPAIAASSAAVPLGQFANFMGGLLPGIGGPGAAVPAFGLPALGDTLDAAPAGAVGEGANGNAQGNGSGAASEGGNRADDDDTDPDESGDVGVTDGRRRARVAVQGDAELTTVDEQPVLSVRFAVEHAARARGTEVRVDASTMLDGDVPEDEPPVGEAKPQVLRWVAPDGSVQRGSMTLFVPADAQGEWRVDVLVPGEVMIDVALRASSRTS